MFGAVVIRLRPCGIRWNFRMTNLKPASPEELCEALQSASSAGQTILLRGSGTKDRMGGPVQQPDCQIDLTGLNRVLQYEPRDLTISVEAGMPWSQFESLLATNNQMVPLDPPFRSRATVGGVIATNSSGPRRRLYGTARDVVIGMQFATLEGKLVQSGGMVVKNVAGLDMGKLMIGSFGTLAAIATVNFKLIPIPQHAATVIRSFPSLAEAIGYRDDVLQSILQPSSLDILNPEASALVGMVGWNVVIHVEGPSEIVITRYHEELGGDLASSTLLDRIAQFTPSFLTAHPQGAMARVSTSLTGVGPALAKAAGPAIARAASGVVHRYYEDAREAQLANEEKGVIEFGPENRDGANLWPQPGSDFEIMNRVKEMFDPQHLLNRGRLYGRI
jgi:glycolate oxidase FAD binding subunit